MSSSEIDIREALSDSVTVTDEALVVELTDGRTVAVPLAWFPRLIHGTTGERSNWRLIGRGEGIHWPALDEDISVQSLLSGHPSAETLESLAIWIKARKAAKWPAPIVGSNETHPFV
jgi:hypothetical protein